MILISGDAGPANISTQIKLMSASLVETRSRFLSPRKRKAPSDSFYYYQKTVSFMVIQSQTLFSLLQTVFYLLLAQIQNIQLTMWRSGSNKQNVRESLPNGSRRSIKLKSSDKRTQREHPTDETAFFNASQGGPEVQQEGQEKLIQLTAQCAQYFERFTAEKDHHLQVIGRAFSEISEKVEQAFGRIILETQRKLNEIRAFLVREHERLRVQKKEQEECLNSLLEEIKSVHLTRLEAAENMDLKEILADYAATLDKFFNIMMEIEGSSYEDGVEQCMNFINNLVKQELTTIITHKFPPKVDDLITGNFTEDCFTFELDGLRPSESTVSLLQERCSKQSTNLPNIFEQLQAIKTHQSARESHINQYRTLISARDPFRAIRIPPS